MELRKEFQDIYDKNLRALNGNYLNRSEALYEAVKDCQELADRPPRKLSDVEIRSLVENHGQVWETKNLMDQLCRRVEAAAHAKQREPETVKFRAARHKKYGEIQMVNARSEINDMWEWLEPAQEIEVKLP